MSHLSARLVALTTRKVFERFASQGLARAKAGNVGSIVTITKSEILKLGRFMEFRLQDELVLQLPKSDPFEMRKSVSLELSGAANGSKVVHVFENGAIKSSKQLLEEETTRDGREKRLSAQENWYPHLDQTNIREKALSDMLEELEHLRAAETITLDDKEFGKYNAIMRYEEVLREQKNAREMAKAALYGNGKH
ncbi:hypothetical protein M409DRAFT_61374 [Zasmidium cellare ATCC 36951]|uniref:Uncharacterized protein n=1 Tax=Zasmidium cellare ATCC 36951 TaxID=1080233 RepID=A0A6A6BVG3_ZASCE|nr:uncharacterized protein M409DRAFT_61374 [Zasmidium cellare ATCC 36951]KAF2158787.1 hypothetical protein M409DRAFT_61374 [Zasmidium cellare ATCC 36951]